MESDLSELEVILGHTFGHSDVLRRAVTHASAEPRAWNAYERLEFLGDRVLALVMAEGLSRSVMSGLSGVKLCRRSPGRSASAAS